MEAKTEIKVAPVVLTKHFVDRYIERVRFPKDPHEVYSSVVEVLARHKDVIDMVEKGGPREKEVSVMMLTRKKIVRYSAIVCFDEGTIRAITVMERGSLYRWKGGKKGWNHATRR